MWNKYIYFFCAFCYVTELFRCQNHFRNSLECTTVATYCLPEILSIIFLKRLYSRLIQLMGDALYPEMSGQGCPTGSDVSALMPYPLIEKLLFCQTPWVCVSLADCDPIVLLKEATGNRSHPP